MAKKKIEINKLTNLFLGIALGFLMGYRGGTLNLVLAVCAIVITLMLAIIYKNKK